MSNKAVTQMIDPEYTVEFDGKETYVMHNGVKLAMRRDDRWVSIEPGKLAVSPLMVNPCSRFCCGARARCLAIRRHQH